MVTSLKNWSIILYKQTLESFEINQIKNKIFVFFIRFFALSLISILPTMTIFLDLVILKNNVGEISVTEITHEIFLFFTIIIYCYGVLQKEKMRGFLLLVAGFFTVLFVREMDVFLDVVFHGFWFYIAMPISILTIAYVYKFEKDTTIGPLFTFMETKPFFILLLGMIILLVLSRTLGSGNLLWGYLLLTDQVNIVKTVVQEGLELFGYTIIFYGSLIFKYRDYELSSKY